MKAVVCDNCGEVKRDKPMLLSVTANIRPSVANSEWIVPETYDFCSLDCLIRGLRKNKGLKATTT